MGKLIVTRRPQLDNALWRYRIIVDGQRGVSIRSEQMVGIELPPGRHEITARIAWCESKPVGIEVVAEDNHVFEVGTWLTGWRLVAIGVVTAPLPIMVTDFARAGSIPLLYYGAPLAYFLPWATLFVLWRDRYLFLKQIPSLDKRAKYARVSPGQNFRLSELPPIKPWSQLSIRWMMIGVAIVAVVLWAEINLELFMRRSQFRGQAASHGDWEEFYRRFEKSEAADAARLDKAGQDSRLLHQRAAKSARRAEYHATMRRKYEQAIARAWPSVDSDPPAPLWP
jgi:hypothetical protein